MNSFLNKYRMHIIYGEIPVIRQLPNGDFIRPDIFIPVAEKANFTKKLTALIIDNIFDDLRLTLKSQPELYVSINLTPSDLADDHLINHIQAKLEKHEIQPRQVVIELTERVITDEKSLVGLEAIRKAGMAISIDDFGTGSSNINYLAKLHPDVIKVDRSFVVWSESEGPTSTFLEKLISIGKDFHVKVVVEGVETQSQANKCQELGADVGQGYFWFKPMNIKDLHLLLDNKS